MEEVEALAEIGVIFLLFVIGMEFSLKKLATLGAPCSLVAACRLVSRSQRWQVSLCCGA